MLALPEVPQAVAQHWDGMYCLLCPFCRPVFPVVQDTSAFTCAFSDDPWGCLSDTFPSPREPTRQAEASDAVVCLIKKTWSADPS